MALEEGTCVAWLHDLLKPHVTKVLVCDPRKNSLLKAGNKNDRIDARKLADLLRTGLLSAVYHGENGLRTLRELARSYLAVTRDLTRVMNRLKALYRRLAAYDFFWLSEGAEGFSRDSLPKAAVAPNAITDTRPRTSAIWNASL